MPFLTRVKTKRHLARLEAALDRIHPAALAKLGPSKETWKTLQASFEGQLVFPGDPSWDADVRGNCLYPDLAMPDVIAYCEVESDVAWCLSVCTGARIPFSVRSGGHCTAGYSVCAGMVVDVSRMNGVFVDAASMTARVQAGTPLSKLNKALAPYSLHVPGGECDTVCVAGHMQGGGYGFTSRTFGLHLDHVTQVRVMLANQGIVTANRSQNADLFWAVRGGTGGNFGVLLEVDYALSQLGPVWGVCLQWPAADAGSVLTQLQTDFMRSGATSKLGYQLAVATVEGAPCLMMMCMYDGTRDEGMAVLQPLFQSSTPRITLDEVGQYEDLNSKLIDNWFTMPPDGTMEVKSCAYIARTLQPSEWASVLSYFETTPNPFNMIAMEVYGGAVSAVSADDCAFIHRQVDVDLFIDSFCNPSWSYNDEQQAAAWLAGFVQKLEPYGNGHRYQNYPDPNDQEFRWAYWGDAYASLLWVKQKYDPNDVFHYQQSIGPYPEGVRRSDAPSRFSDPDIVYEPHARPGMLTTSKGRNGRPRSPSPLDAPQVGFRHRAREVDPPSVGGDAAQP